MENNIQTLEEACVKYDASLIQQMYKKVTDDEDNVTEKDVYPKTINQAIYDGITGERLDKTIAKVNHISVSYEGDFASTMLTIPKAMRKQGLEVTFVDLDGKINHVVYTSEYIADLFWKDEQYWNEVKAEITKEEFKDKLVQVLESETENEELKEIINGYIDKNTSSDNNSDSNFNKEIELDVTGMHNTGNIAFKKIELNTIDNNLDINFINNNFNTISIILKNTHGSFPMLKAIVKNFEFKDQLFYNSNLYYRYYAEITNNNCYSYSIVMDVYNDKIIFYIMYWYRSVTNYSYNFNNYMGIGLDNLGFTGKITPVDNDYYLWIFNYIKNVKIINIDYIKGVIFNNINVYSNGGKYYLESHTTELMIQNNIYNKVRHYLIKTIYDNDEKAIIEVGYKDININTSE